VLAPDAPITTGGCTFTDSSIEDAETMVHYNQGPNGHYVWWANPQWQIEDPGYVAQVCAQVQ
jgi:hypothetical protein